MRREMRRRSGIMGVTNQPMERFVVKVNIMIATVVQAPQQNPQAVSEVQGVFTGEGGTILEATLAALDDAADYANKVAGEVDSAASIVVGTQGVAVAGPHVVEPE